MSANTTQPTDVAPAAFIAAIEAARRRDEAHTLLEMMTRLSGEEPAMWGPSMIGFGSYHYRYDSGREGDFFRTGFSPRKANMVVYIVPGFDGQDDLMSRLGKHKTGVSCLYLTRLANVDLGVLEELIQHSLDVMQKKYPKAGDG